MSLLSPDRVIVGLAPHRLSILRISGGLRQRIMKKHDQLLETNDATRWQDAVKTLEILLATKAWGSGKIAVVVSNHWVHYAVVPGKRSLGPTEQKALADIVFKKIYGEISLGWELRTSPASSKGIMIASGIPLPLIEAIRAACGKRLGSIRPLLMPIANTARRSINNNTGRLVIAEQGRITFASIQNGQWQSIVSRAIPATKDVASLKKILEEDRVLQEQDSDGLLWVCNVGEELNLPQDTSGITKTIEPKVFAGKSGKDHTGLANWGIQ